jgi:hypothetical protein
MVCYVRVFIGGESIVFFAYFNTFATLKMDEH